MVNIENNVGWSPQAAGVGSYTEISGIFPLVCTPLGSNRSGNISYLSE